MYSSTNPGGVGHAWYKQTFIAPVTGDTSFVSSTVEDNAFVNAEYRATLDKLTGWQKQAWRYGNWDIAAGQYFTMWRPEAHVSARIPEAAQLRRVWAALDYGFVHYTVAYLLGEDGDGHLYIVDEHAERRLTVGRQAAGIQAMIERHGLSIWQLDAFLAGPDVFSTQRDGGSVAGEYAQYGVMLTPANNDRIQGAAEWLNRLGDPDAGVAPRITVSERCKRLIECLPSLEHNPYRAEDVLKVDTDEDGLGGDDPYDAARYGIMFAAGLRPAVGASPLSGWRG
ncbi:MAG: hypothetical protein HGB05_11100 [Chloroflexi bacterium]|nr:hypothetical protein [Chloroflexota bacterium]